LNYIILYWGPDEKVLNIMTIISLHNSNLNIKKNMGEPAMVLAPQGMCSFALADNEMSIYTMVCRRVNDIFEWFRIFGS